MSISRERFEKLKKGDFLLMNSGKLREVVKVSQWINRFHYKKTLHTSVYLKSLNGYSTTCCHYSDLKYKIVAIFSLKEKDPDWG